MKNFFIKKWSDLFIYLLKTVREWFENGSRMVRQMCVAWAMLRGKLVNCAKSLMQIFATYATSASANFVGKESNESTVRYALWSRISLTKLDARTNSCSFNLSISALAILLIPTHSVSMRAMMMVIIPGLNTMRRSVTITSLGIPLAISKILWRIMSTLPPKYPEIRP